MPDTFDPEAFAPDFEEKICFCRECAEEDCMDKRDKEE